MVQTIIVSGPLCGGQINTALSYLGSVIALSLGCAISEQMQVFHDYLPYIIDIQEVHATGLSSMIAGFPEPAALHGQAQGG